jgi:hypothetical protein
MEHSLIVIDLKSYSPQIEAQLITCRSAEAGCPDAWTLPIDDVYQSFLLVVQGSAAECGQWRSHARFTNRDFLELRCTPTSHDGNRAIYFLLDRSAGAEPPLSIEVAHIVHGRQVSVDVA